MKTPWSSLLQYGTAAAAMIVISLSVVGLMFVVALAVIVSKILVFTR